MHISEYNQGYYQALKGIILAQKNSDDRYAFISSLDLNNKKELHNYQKEFSKQKQSPIHADYDKGFFAVWVDFMSALTRIETRKQPTVVSNVDQVEKLTEEEKETIDEVKKGTIDKKNKLSKKETEKELATNFNDVKELEIRQSSLFDFSR
jgi:hypothetical protein